MKTRLLAASRIALILGGATIVPVPVIRAQQVPKPAAAPAAAPAPAPPAVADQGAADAITLQHINAPIMEVLDTYQTLTGKRIIRDPQLESAVVTVEGRGMAKAEAIEFIEKSLLLGGFAIVPSGEKMVKVISTGAGKMPASEGVDMILDAAKLPESDKVVSHVLALQHLKSEEAAQAFAQIIPLHPYGKIVAVPNARALVLTENSNTIRAFIKLAQQVDVAPGETIHKTLHLERADAEDVAKALAELLGISAGATTAAKHQGAAPPPMPRPANPQQAAAQAAAQAGSATTVGGTEAEAAAPKIQAIQRTNSLLVIARPLDIEYIESLVKEFDAASDARSFISRKLRYMDVVEFANVAKDALLRGVKDQGTTGQIGTTPDNKSTTTTTTPASNFGGSGFGGGFGGGLGGFGGVGGGLSGGFGALGGGASLQETQIAKTQSVLIGKTLLIVEPGGGRFFASGPPEQLRLLGELADELDKRPQQILLSAIIGEFTLADNFQFGVDWIHTIESFGKNNQNAAGGTLFATGNKAVDFSSFSKLSDFPNLSGFSVYGQIASHLNGFLHTLDESKRFHVLQRPTITTLNHKLATISTGQQLAIPGQTLTQGGTTVSNATVVSTTQYIPVELRLDIIPHVFDQDEVKLEFNQRNFDVSGFATISGNQVPNLSTQELKNTIIVPNGTTIMLGGLITERDTKNRSGIPFLIRIPLIKYLFGSTTKNKERRELLIFVQPRILPSGLAHVEEQMEIEKQAQSYPRTREFADPGSPVDATAGEAKRIPRALPVDETPGAANRIDLSPQFGGKVR